MTVVRGRARTGARAVLRTVFCGALAAVGLLAAGCGSDNIIYGTVATTLSSVSSQFSTYTVNLSLSELTRTDGQIAFIEGAYGAGRAERVDLARLTDVSELLSAGAVPIGTYKSATFTLDYGSPIVDVDVNGVPTPATVVDSTGAALSTISVTVTFDPDHPLVVQTGQGSRLNINFDLTAGSVIDTSKNPIQVTTQPVIAVSATPVDTQPIRARGVFVATNNSTGEITFNILPLYESNQYAGQTIPLGALHVQTGPQTTYNVNGQAYLGSAGVTAVGGLQVNTLIAAYGTLGDLSTSTPSFTATDIYAGSTLQDLAQDHFTGTIASRSGNTLKLHGVSVLLRNGVYTYLPDLPVTVGASTIVSEDTQPNATGLDIHSLSIGQRIDVSGNVICASPSEVTPNCATAVNGSVLGSLDATSGQARMVPTRVWGTLSSTTPASATLNMVSLDGFAPTPPPGQSGFSFDFTGTGAGGAQADPANYVVDTGSLDLSATPPGSSTPIAVDGFVTPFGTAPPDFTALAVTPGAAFENSQLIVVWPAGGIKAPFNSADSGSIVVNLANTTSAVDIGLSSQSLSSSVTIQPASGVTPELSIGNVTAGILMYGTFTALESQLDTIVGGTGFVQTLVAQGSYNATTGIFTAKRIHIVTD
ncbi:MAG TPA: hypothetical protein VJQ47_02750 [Steroidobacteraceae bacterium]|nr:hypothetical protein [Steroidobacteraceae bacterium]